MTVVRLTDKLTNIQRNNDGERVVIRTVIPSWIYRPTAERQRTKWSRMDRGKLTLQILLFFMTFFPNGLI